MRAMRPLAASLVVTLVTVHAGFGMVAPDPSRPEVAVEQPMNASDVGGGETETASPRGHARRARGHRQPDRGRRRSLGPSQDGDQNEVPEPYFAARVVGERVEVEGVRECRLGHQLPTSNGKRPDGVYAGWSWDGSRLELSTDRYGLYPVYYFADDRRVVVSTSLSTLLACGAPRELDDAALAVFLRLGCFVGDDTPFKAIRTAPPDADFVWRPGALRVEGRLVIGKTQGLTREEALDAYVALFARAIERRLDTTADGVVVPLSGGQDSRHIALELARTGHAPDSTVTVRYHPPRRDEVVEAGAVAAHVGVPHVALGQTRSLFETTRRAIARQNLCSLEHSWIFALVDHVRGRVGTLYDGIGGDVLSAGLFLDAATLALFESNRLGALADHLLGRRSILRLPAGPLGHRLKHDVAVERLRRELERHVDAPNPVGSFHFWNRTRRCIAQSGYRLIQDVPRVLSPYLDHELFDLLAGLPASMLLDHQFHAQAIARGYPEAASIPYARKPSYVPGGSRAMTALGRQMLASTLRRSPSRMVSEGYLLPRLARCLVDREYAVSAHWFEREALYLWALEDALDDDATGQQGGRA